MSTTHSSLGAWQMHPPRFAWIGARDRGEKLALIANPRAELLLIPNSWLIAERKHLKVVWYCDFDWPLGPRREIGFNSESMIRAAPHFEFVAYSWKETSECGVAVWLVLPPWTTTHYCPTHTPTEFLEIDNTAPLSSTLSCAKLLSTMLALRSSLGMWKSQLIFKNSLVYPILLS